MDNFYDRELGNFETAVLHELDKRENADLRHAVATFDGDGGFMYGFDNSLTKPQRKRWQNIVNAADTMGLSGSAYGFGCRQVQFVVQGKVSS